MGIIVYGKMSYIDVQTNTGLQQEVEFQAIVATCVFCYHIHSLSVYNAIEQLHQYG